MLIASLLGELEKTRLKRYLANRMGELFIKLNDPFDDASKRSIRSDIDALNQLYDSL